MGSSAARHHPTIISSGFIPRESHQRGLLKALMPRLVDPSRVSNAIRKEKMVEMGFGMYCIRGLSINQLEQKEEDLSVLDRDTHS